MQRCVSNLTGLLMASILVLVLALWCIGNIALLKFRFRIPVLDRDVFEVRIHLIIVLLYCRCVYLALVY